MRFSHITGLGLINQDLLAVVPHWERDTKVSATHYFEQVGGPVPVAMTAIARLGTSMQVSFLGIIGDDTAGEKVSEALTRQGVQGHFCQIPGLMTSRSLVFLHSGDGSRTLANYAENLPSLVFTPEQESVLEQTELLHIDGRDLEATMRAVERVKANNGMVSLDLGTMRPGREALLMQCDIILASQKGGAGAFPEHPNDPLAQVRLFRERYGASIAGVTLAEKGLALACDDTPEGVYLPAFPVEKVLDTCGAGDTFHGAYLWAFANHLSPIQSAFFAQAAVALRIQQYGNEAGLPTASEVHDFLARSKPLT
jgi:sulfofructose kinase